MAVLNRTEEAAKLLDDYISGRLSDEAFYQAIRTLLLSGDPDIVTRLRDVLTRQGESEGPSLATEGGQAG